MILKEFGEYLSSRGHSVTQIRFKDRNPSQPPQIKNSNISVIDLPISRFTDNECIDYINDDGEIDINISATKLLWKDGESVYKVPSDIFCVTRAHCHTLFTVHSAKMKKVLDSGNFELAIVDIIANECGLAMAKSLGIPVVGFWMFSFQGGETLRSPVFNPPSIVPSFLSSLPPKKWNFLERVYNFIVHLTHRALLAIQESIANDFIKERYPNLPPVRDLFFDLDFTFIHTNFLVDSPKLIAPNSKYVGGLHIRSPRKLRKELKEFVEGAKKGVIIFSLGFTGYSSDNVPLSFIRDLLHIIEKLEGYRLIMRFDKDVISSPLPENVLVLKWLPQQDLLAHSAVKLFINHGGMGGIQESVYYGVPMVIIPIFGDQNDNAARIQHYELGLYVVKSRLNYDNLRFAIHEVLFNDKYSEKSKFHQSLWKDEFCSSQEETAYWIELLIKYGHLDHLKIKGVNISLFQYFSLDVILFFLSILFISTTLVLGFIIYNIFGKCFFVHDTYNNGTKRKIIKVN
ncbi:UGT [Lepeophtheirus salmonis]|uniref:UGT n=1 Tax=Lepeophtheirus salmonis TaxID=72036 RepID=A0A7R8D425_LEPSM|nr:UGT [Lepeophtheirus salmonis]CAF2970237.1 UGT [Lepeophtheirus salmonis]